MANTLGRIKMDSICINAFANAYFGQLVRDYQVPRRGPNWTRYAESDLDLWMRDPKAFVPPVEIMAMQGGNLCEFYFCWH